MNCTNQRMHETCENWDGPLKVGNILGKKREHIPVQESLSVNVKLPSNLFKAFQPQNAWAMCQIRREKCVKGKRDWQTEIKEPPSLNSVLRWIKWKSRDSWFFSLLTLGFWEGKTMFNDSLMGILKFRDILVEEKEEEKRDWKSWSCFYALIYLHLQSICKVPAVILGAEDEAVNKTGKALMYREPLLQWQRRDNKEINT